MLLVLSAMRADAAPGDDDATLVPMTPCRLVDSRVPGQPDLGPGDTQTYTAHGVNGPVAGSQCTIPTDAVGLSMNVTALEASAPTFWTIWENGVPRPEASSLNPAPGQPPTPNAVNTPISASGEFNVFNSQGTVGILIDVNGYYTKSSLAELHQRIATLEDKLASVTATTVDGRPTVRFTGVNVQILDGTGETSCAETAVPEPCNGLGNLIVGYNEGATDERIGSHNVVVGIGREWTDYAGLVTGTSNEIRDASAVAIGGFSNIASGNGAVTVGGQFNNSSGSYTVATGGIDNVASVTRATVTGGRSNVAGGTDVSISGGNQNVASGSRTVILGGEGCSQFTTDGVFYGSPGGSTCTQLN